MFFDNDRPRYRYSSKDTTVNVTYGQTYNRYISRQAVFRNGYAANQGGALAGIARQEINDFFDDEIRKGWNDLEEFCSLLLPYLQTGNSIEIIVQGYASPLAGGDYNKNLTKRRISSVINQLRAWNNNALATYLDNQTLIVTEDPKGEDDAPEGISDSGADRRSSVFSPKASRERRVRITDVRRQQSIMSWLEKDQ